MKFTKITIGLTGFLLTCSAYGFEDLNHSGQVHLDQSKNIYFDQFSSNTFSLQLLQNKNKFNKQDLILGGSGQFDFQHWQGHEITISQPPPSTYQQGTQVYFTQAQFDMMSNLNNNWVSAFLSPVDSHIAQNGPDGNNVYLAHAFLLLGNLDKTPLYLTLGINDIPFGVFGGSGAWDTPLTANYFNPAQSPQVSLGFYKNNFNAVVTEYEDQVNYAGHSVYSLYYNNSIKSFTYGFGAGYLTHLYSNSTGNAFNNHNRNRRSNLTPSNLGNVSDLSTKLGYGPLTLTVEYVFGSQSVSVNRNKPLALGETLSYIHSIYGKDTTFGIGYSNSANLRDVPTGLEGQDGTLTAASGIKNSWVLSVTRPVISDAFQLGLNASKDILYSKKSTYTYTLDFMAYL